MLWNKQQFGINIGTSGPQAVIHCFFWQLNKRNRHQKIMLENGRFRFSLYCSTKENKLTKKYPYNLTLL